MELPANFKREIGTLFIASALAILLVAFSTGCSGNGGEQADDGSDAATAAVEATLDRLVVGAPDREGFCDVLSARQLIESFGKRDPLKHCLETAERRGDGLATYEVLEVQQECARVEAVDQRGREALFFMRETNGQWLVHNIEDPSSPTESSEAVCGEVELSETGPE